MITVLFFARLRDEIGCDSLQVDASDCATAADLLLLLRAQSSQFAAALNQGQLMVAVNQEMVQLDSPIKDNDEVAFFPPVTGG